MPLTIEDAQAPVLKLWEEVTAHRCRATGQTDPLTT
jgi:hypothetical protein